MHCCLQCGWNVSRARKTIEQTKFAPYALIGVFCLFFIGTMADAAAPSRLGYSVIFIALAGLGILPLRKMKQGRAILANHSGNLNSSAVESTASRLQREWEWLLNTLPPREVQLNSKGRRVLVREILSLLLAEAVLALFFTGPHWALRKRHAAGVVKLLHPVLIWGVAIMAIYAILICGLLVASHTGAHRLLARGHLIVGRVVSLERGNHGIILNIEFPHPSGEIAKTRGGSRSEAFFEGMTLPVFCNPSKLKDSFVLLKDGDYEVVHPGLSRSPVPQP